MKWKDSVTPTNPIILNLLKAILSNSKAVLRLCGESKGRKHEESWWQERQDVEQTQYGVVMVNYGLILQP